MPRAARRPPRRAAASCGGPPRPPPNSTASSMVTDARSPVSIGNEPSSSARIPSSPISNDPSGSVVVDGARRRGNTSCATSQPKGRRTANSSKKQKVEKRVASEEEEENLKTQGFHNQEQQRTQQLHVQGPPLMMSASLEIGILNRRLREYMYFQHSRPADNSLAYWRKFVAEFYALKARKRWCMSSHENAESSELNDVCRTANLWECDLCGAKFGKGFEARFEVLPRLYQTRFDGTATDELLFLENAREWNSSGFLLLDYAKAVIESVYEHQRVVHEGRLRVIFTPYLKILSWEFCVRRHEEFIPRRLVASQANQLLGVVRNFQAAVAEHGSCELSPQELQASVNMFGTACCQLGRSLQSQSSTLGFPRKFAWSLQMIDVVNSMKDLIDFSQEHKIGAIDTYGKTAIKQKPPCFTSRWPCLRAICKQGLNIDIGDVLGFAWGMRKESLRSYNRPAKAWFQTGERQGMDPRETAQGMPDYDRKSSKITGLLHGLSSIRSNNNVSSLNNTLQSSATMAHHQNSTSASLNYNSLQPDIPRSINISNQSRPTDFPISSSSLPAKHNTISCLSWQSTPRCVTAPFKVEQHSTGQIARDMMNSYEGVDTHKHSFKAPTTNGDEKGESAIIYGVSSRGLPSTASAGSIEKASELVSDNTVGMIPNKNKEILSVNPELDPFWQELMNNGIGDLGYKL